MNFSGTTKQYSELIRLAVGSTIVVISVLMWSSRLLTEWGTDFGVYYAGSYFINDNYRLYQEFFDHKGPFLYLFLKFIGSIIGWGHWRAYISLVMIMLTFYVPTLFILSRQRIPTKYFMSGILLSVFLLYGQPTNSSIAFFQASLLLISFWILTFSHKGIWAINASFIFYTLAIYTRIDALIFTPIFMLVLTSMILKERSLVLKCLVFTKIILAWAIIFLIISWIFSAYFDYKTTDFILHNVHFNRWYSEVGVREFIYRPSAYALMMGSLLFLPIVYFLFQLKDKIAAGDFFSGLVISFDPSNSTQKFNIYLIIIVFLGFLGWLLTGSDKNYHLLIFSVPLFFYFIIQFNSFHSEFIGTILIFAPYILFLTLVPPVVKIAKDLECLSSPLCESSAAYGYSDSIDFLSNLDDESVTIVGGKGWAYFFSNKRPDRSINDWWLYYRSVPFDAPALLDQHNKLIMPFNSGKLFLIDKNLLDHEQNKNFLFSELLSRSKLVQDQNEYSVYIVE